MKSLIPKDDHYEANVWPAVTDSVLLIASIFIVLSVASMQTMAKKLRDYQYQKSGSEGTVCLTWQLTEEALFATEKRELKDPVAAKSKLKDILDDMGTARKKLIPEAEREWGAGQFYVVLEVAGHTDDEGARNFNWELSAGRAVSVVKVIEYLLAENSKLKSALNINVGREAKPGSTILRAAGYCYSAPFEPVVQSGKKLTGTKLKAARKANRRVEIRLFAQPIPLVHRREVDTK